MTAPVHISVPDFFQGRTRHYYPVDDPKPMHWSLTFRVYKFLFDKLFSLSLLPIFAALSVILLLLNPIFNPGPLLFVQDRLGRNQKPFRMIKFRTMAPTVSESRTAKDGVEQNRITLLGRILRKLRIDEIPNIINVLKGEMSVIGPRPDALDHAREYLTEIPHYAYRYRVKPGITGLAQVESGYAEGFDATARKAYYDQHYVETSCGRLDVYITWRTILVVLSGFGAK
jgi:lipopolysaccharide/colanic/teichoic acid biosynthesis glycosyltransferase